MGHGLHDFGLWGTRHLVYVCTNVCMAVYGKYPLFCGVDPVTKMVTSYLFSRPNRHVVLRKRSARSVESAGGGVDGSILVRHHFLVMNAV